ncbi:MAG: C4-type zinc ribbon domain-containing protein [Geobacteraceae bacterium]
MRANLNMLDMLQKIDLRMDALREGKEALLKDITAMDVHITEARNNTSVKQAELAAVEAEKQELEGGLADELENILRSETRLREIKTQKEYQAVSKEIATAKKLKAELEEQLLQKIGLAEELQSSIAACESDLRALEESLAVQRAEALTKMDQLDKSMAKDLTTREASSKGLPASMLKRYGALREQRKGVAVVEARDGSCLGCNMNLPPQLYNSLFRCDELIACPHCQRVLLLRLETNNG